MGKKVETMKLKGNDYAKVATRTKEFWEKYPHGKIATTHEVVGEMVVFKAFVWKNNADFLDALKNGVSAEVAMLSANAEGTTQLKSSEIEKTKGFEKLETVAVGRALGLLGFLANGEIATDEEMLEFEEFKEEKAAEARQTACEALAAAKTMDELKATFSTLPRDLWQDKEVIAMKDKLKAKFMTAKAEEPAEDKEEKSENSQN